MFCVFDKLFIFAALILLLSKEVLKQNLLAGLVNILYGEDERTW